MSGYGYSSAGSQYIYDTIEDAGYEAFDTTYPTWGYMQNQLNSSMVHEQNPVQSLEGQTRPWPSTDVLRRPLNSSQHLSSSSFSSVPLSYRLSDNSTFSQDSLRDSMTSFVSGYSHTSDMSRNQHFSLAKQSLCHRPANMVSRVANSAEEPCPRPIKGKANTKLVAQDKDYFKTCVSVNKQSRLCSKKHKYFCTSCERPFVEKADWKRHEETYQERFEMFKCDLCPAIYFLEKDFTKHHAQSHRCTSCAETTTRSKKAHALSAKRRRMTRTGWGCGFCCHFSTDWTERCDHIARHMEKEGLPESSWYHSKVIWSLLQQPAIYNEWMRLLRTRPELAYYAWNQNSTGRVEGYPESNSTPQLQDYLEYFTPRQDAAAVAQLAYSKMVKPSTPSAPPPVPPKNYCDGSLQDWANNMGSWAQITNSIVEDDVLPTGICGLDGWYAS